MSVKTGRVSEIAEQVDMTVSGAWSRYERALPSKPPRLGRWQQVLADALDQNLAIGVRAAVADHLGRAPTRAELTAARRAALGRARMLHVPGADGEADEGDRTYLVRAKPNVIMSDIRLRGLGVAGSYAAGPALALTRPKGWNRSKVAVLANQDRSVTSGMVRGLSSGTWTGWVDGA